MRNLIAIAAGFALAASVAPVASFAAATAGGSSMKECAAQWQTMKTQNKTGGQTYKDFSKTCMSKGAAATPAAAPAPAPVAAAKPAAVKATATTTASASTTKAAPGQRMKDCGAKWQSLKAANKTNGQTYQQFSKGCLSNKG
jgi:hypothetical protein